MAGQAIAPQTRTPVSMRLPSAVVEAVSDYASREHVRKTDAFLHFLTLGLQAENATSDASKLESIEARLDELTELLRQRQGSEATSDKELIEGIASTVSQAATTYPAICSVYLFGSLARGTAHGGSDIDLRIVLDRSQRFNLHDLEHFCKQVEQSTGRDVDAITASKIADKALAEAIEREKVLIYERKEN